MKKWSWPLLIVLAGCDKPAPQSVEKKPEAAQTTPQLTKEQDQSKSGTTRDAGEKTALLRGPYLERVTPTSIVVCFQTAAKLAGVVEYGTDDKYGQKAVGPEGQKHMIELRELKPATRYQYRAHGAIGSFRTAPEGDSPFTFVVYGDCRTDHKTHEKIVARILKLKDMPAFVVNTGDLVEDGLKTELWTKFFQITANLVKDAPLYPAPGNHENNAPEYYEIFGPLGSKAWYSFDFGAAHFTFLDMNPGRRKDQEQIAWAKNDLAKTTARIKFVVYHHAILASNTNPARLGDEEDVQKTWGPIFEEAKVTVAFQGHIHGYQRAVKNGVTYITSAGGGAPLYEMGAILPETRYAKSAYHFLVIRIEAQKIVGQAIDITGGQLETFTLPR